MAQKSLSTSLTLDTCIEVQDDTKNNKPPNEEISTPLTSHDENMCKKLYNNGIIRVFVIVILIICITFVSFFAALAVLPLLLISLVVTRLIQFIRHDEHGYIKAFQVKLIIRNALCIDVLLILLGVGVIALAAVYCKATHAYCVDGSTFDISDEEWVAIISIVCGFYLLSFLLLKSVHAILVKTRAHVVVEAISEIIDCIIFLWAELVVKARLEIQGDDEANKYFTGVEIIICYFIGYNLITLFTHLLVSALSVISRQKNQIFEKLNNKYLVYYANGLKWSIDFVLSVLMLLLSLLYFKEDLFETVYAHATAPTPAPTPKQVQAPAPASAQKILKDLLQGKGVWPFVAWSLVSLLICAFLWLFKTVLLLSWKAHTVYDRLRNRILENGKELYYLCAFGGKFRIFKQDDKDLGTQKEMGEILLMDEKQGNKQSVDDIKRIAQYFLLARTHLYKELFISDILQTLSDLDDRGLSEKLDQLISAKVKPGEVGEEHPVNRTSSSSPKELSSLFGRCVYKVFSFICFSDIRKEEIQDDSKHLAQNSSDEESFVGELFKKDGQQVVRAHSRCMVLANTLSSAKEVASCLNNIIIVLILVATFIIWLLLTKLATKEVIVFFASSLLAGTFIFGNTCKTLFQSILFVFVVHPFDVGDLCIIDDILLEVKNIGIWKTIFSKVGWQEEIIYPNTQLSNKKIINHKSDIDWNDHVELEVSSVDKEKIIEVEKEIEKYLDGEKAKFVPGHNCVELKECPIGENLKLVIDFKHNTNLKNSTYFECVKEKRKLRSKFVLYVQDLVNQKHIRGSNNPDDAACSEVRPLKSTKEPEEEEEEEDEEESKSEEEDGKEEESEDAKECAQEKDKCGKEDCVETDKNENSKYKDKKAKEDLEITEERNKQS